MSKRTDEVIKKMAELLRMGAVMLNQSCPMCGSPLFRLRSGEIVCPVHGPVIVVKTDTEAVELTTKAVLDSLERNIAQRIIQIMREDKRGNTIERIKEIIYLLDALERARRIKRMGSKSGGAGKVKQ
ncbi:MAG: hypothetical protein B6U73_03155 [Desulfurococcales archaeon ex4484_204]|nr:MAG: hypothetical protein B6U73_03155 [Desulfurococcales archaeon ex4484_204]